MLSIPGADEAGATASGEASRTIVAQATNFNEFRRKLAESVPESQVNASNRQASGKVEAKVEDRTSNAATPDKLTLSKGAIQGSAAEDKLAKDRQSKEISTRVAELSKNIESLNKLATAPLSSPSTAAVAASSTKGAGIAVVKPGSLPVVPAPAATPAVAASSQPSASKAAAITTPAETTSPINSSESVTAAPIASAPAALTPSSASVASPAIAASNPASAPVPAPTASQPTAGLAKKSLTAALPQLPETSLLDDIRENPLALPALAGLLLLLAGLGIYRYKKRNKFAQVDSSFLESRLQPDSFFGASGGQRIDTNEAGASGSSLVYSPSQLDAAGDVDPVAEADVYLAYGRDLQAEEILKEAMRTSPTRVAILGKLLEIYAKRRDAKAFETVAIAAFNLTRGEGPEWTRIGEMGRLLEPANPRYQSTGQPVVISSDSINDTQVNATAALSSSPDIKPIEAQQEVLIPKQVSTVDLDLDFSIDHESAATPTLPFTTTTPSQLSEQPKVRSTNVDSIFDGLDIDFSNSMEPPKPAPVAFQENSFDELSRSNALPTALPTSSLNFPSNAPTAEKPAATFPVIAATDNGMLEFDLGSLSLELDEPTTTSPVSNMSFPASDDPLETKFALAEEFRTLGDKVGARLLADEVVAQAKGALKSKAQAFLNDLS